MKNRKYSIFIALILIVLSFSFGINGVDAVTKRIERSKTTGQGGTQIKGDGWSKSMTYKGIDKASNRNAFCTTFDHPSDVGFKNGTYKSEYCDASKWFRGVTSNQFIVAGQIVDTIDEEVKDADNKYVYTVLTLNTYFSTVGKNAKGQTVGVTGAVNFSNISKSKQSQYGTVSSSLATKIKSWIAKAKEKTKMIKDAKSSFATPKIEGPSSKTMTKNTKGNYYGSGAISFTQDSKLANGIALSNTITITKQPTGGTATICTNVGLTKCSTTQSNVGIYYIKVTPTNGINNVSGSVEVTIKSTPKSFTYKKGIVLCKTKSKSNQAMLITENETYNTAKSRSVTLKIPSSNELEILKVDENGNNLSKANFELYDSSGNKLNWSSNNGTSFKYSSTSILGKEFKLVEKTAPSGYKIKGESTLKVPDKNGNFCYEGSGDSLTEKITELQYCNSAKWCQISYKSYVVDSEGNNTVDENGNEILTDDTLEPVEGDCTSIDANEHIAADKKVKEDTISKTDICKSSDGKETIDSKYCENMSNYTSIEVNGNSVLFMVANEINTVKISKKDATGEVEVPGATLKICADEDYSKSGNDCSPAKTVDDIELSWVSSNEEKTFSGLPIGKYYIIETIPPSGYKLVTTATEFSIDESGKITTGGKVATDDTIVINNNLNEITISKTDIVTSKELPGAQLTICLAGLKSDVNAPDEEESEESTNTTDDEKTTTTSSKNPDDYTPVLNANGDCIPVTLTDGSGEATWTSTDKPHTIKGLPSGEYYLVETTAPSGYSTTESILFKMNDNGVLTDIAGNILANNKIVMKDKPIKDVKTGYTPIIIASALCLFSIAIASYSYIRVSGGTGAVVSKLSKIRRRKIHK